MAFDATSAHAHVQHAPLLAARGIRCIDLTPAALGPAVVPDVNLDEHLDAPDANLVTCGAQATVPVVAALSALGPVRYAEIVSTVASRSAGPGPARTSTSSRSPPPARWRRWAAPGRARRSSS